MKTAAPESEQALPVKEELELINRYALKPLKSGEVFVFSVVLCDNEIDRDNERFDIPALHTLAKLFLGKSGIFDHSPKAKNQTARIFACEVISDSTRTTAAGEAYHALKARAYMLRSEKNGALIAEIEAGIKKEVSVGCAVSEVRCSVCGKNQREGVCGHRSGEWIDGKRCCHILCKPTDAYEWSFVAVPAQQGAGVSKAYTAQEGGTTMEHILKKLGQEALAGSEAVTLKEYIQRLEKEAACGRAYKSGMEKEVLRLAFAGYPEANCELIKAAVERMELDELREFKRLFESDEKSFLACTPQLRPSVEGVGKQNNTEFKI